MAIGLAKVSIVKAGASAVGLSAYVTRSQRTDGVTGERFSFSRDAHELVATGILVPEDAPAWARDGASLWTKATEKQLTKDRKTGEVRFKKEAQIAKQFVFAMPKELSEAENVELAKALLQDTFGGKGVGVEWALHRDEGERLHLHVMQTTNTLTEKGFGNKARHMNPSFASKDGKRFISEQDHWEVKWTEFQNRWFKEHGVTDEHGETLAVDPFKIVPEVREGKARHIDGADLTAANDERKEEMRKALREEPALVLGSVTERQATFTRREVVKAFRVHGIDGAEADALADTALRSSEVLELFEKGSGRATHRYTTATVRGQELQTLAAVRAIAEQPASRIDAQLVDTVSSALTMNAEQDAALRRAVGLRFSITQGDPGTGKSHMMRGMRLVFEQSGREVIGAAPTNTVASDMRKDGFSRADTLHATLYALDKGKLRLSAKSVLIVDEAAMTETAILDRLTAHCERTGAELHIVGDDKQLGAVGRGGLYTELRAEHGEAQLRDIVRQGKDGWMKTASEDMAAGRVGAAVDAYFANDAIAVTDTQDDARQRLVDEWNGHDFVFASTNKAVNDLNNRLRMKRIENGEIGARGEAVMSVPTVRGSLSIVAGDRVQMHGNVKAAGIYNGTVGTVTGFSNAFEIKVRFDDGREATLPADFKAWGYGYAGTVYRGQGKTMRGAVALHDSPLGWGAESGLVGFTRHKERFKLYTSRDIAQDRDTLVDQLSRSNRKTASVAYDARPVNRETKNGKRISKDRFSNRFNKATVARTGETLAGTPTLDSVPRLRGSAVARPGAGAAAGVLPGHEARQLRQRPADAPAGLRRPGPVAARQKPQGAPQPPPAAEVAARAGSAFQGALKRLGGVVGAGLERVGDAVERVQAQAEAVREQRRQAAEAAERAQIARIMAHVRQHGVWGTGNTTPTVQSVWRLPAADQEWLQRGGEQIIQPHLDAFAREQRAAAAAREQAEARERAQKQEAARQLAAERAAAQESNRQARAAMTPLNAFLHAREEWKHLFLAGDNARFALREEMKGHLQRISPAELAAAPESARDAVKGEVREMQREQARAERGPRMSM